MKVRAQKQDDQVSSHCRFGSACMRTKVNDSLFLQDQFDRRVDKGKANAKAQFVFRPRPVLSSPDNDGLIGSINKTVKERPNVQRKHKLEDKMPAKPKVLQSSMKAENIPIVFKITENVSTERSSHKQRTSLETKFKSHKCRVQN